MAKTVFNSALTIEQVNTLCEEIVADDIEVLERDTNDFKGTYYMATDKTGEFIFKLGGYQKHQYDKENFKFQEKLKEYERKEV